MIKKVSVGRLRPGMFIHDLDCGWMEHPFARNHFAVDSETVVTQLARSGLREVYIDTEKGLDDIEAPTAADIQEQVSKEISAAAKQKTEPARVSTHEELTRARQVHAEANLLIRNIMRDVRLGKQVHIEQMEPVVEKITTSVLRNSSALLSLTRIKDKDDYTFQHSVGVATLMVAFCRGLDMDDETIHQAGIGGLLHDIGKTLTPDHILNKPGKLTPEELDVMRRHVTDGENILNQTPNISEIAMQVTAQHHERFDGSGYPLGVNGAQISKIGQMAAIVDVYDAITSDRCYRKGMAPTDTLRKMFEWSKFHFNADLVHAFTRVIGIYPVGTLVLLESGRLAVVAEQRENNMLQPLVRAVFHARHNHYIEPVDIDLSRPFGHGGADSIVSNESPAKWKIDPMKFL